MAKRPRELPSKRRRRARFRNRPAPEAAGAPLTPELGAANTAIQVMAYGPDTCEVWHSVSVDAALDKVGRYSVVWIDVAGLADIDAIQRLGSALNLHPLAIEDIVRPHQRAKVEEYDDDLFIIARMAPLPGENDTEQLSLFVGSNYLLTFQERPGDSFEHVRSRIKAARSRARNLGPDFLMYLLLDAVIDAYFPLMEKCGDTLEDLEIRIVESARPTLIRNLYEVRRDFVEFRRIIWPLREALASLIRDDSSRVKQETRVLLRDCYDHTVQLLDLTETYRELGTSLMDVHLSSVSNRLSEIMKVLTIITVVFIPLSFIAGVYGMNFDTSSRWNMPELKMRFGYIACLTLMALVCLGELYYFWRKGWLTETEVYAKRQDPDAGANVSPQAERTSGIG